MFGFGRQLSTSFTFSPSALVSVPLVSTQPSKLTPELANCDSRPWRSKPNYNDCLKPKEPPQISPNNNGKSRINSDKKFPDNFVPIFQQQEREEEIEEKEEKISSLQSQLDTFLKDGAHDDFFKEKLSQTLKFSSSDEERIEMTRDEKIPFEMVRESDEKIPVEMARESDNEEELDEIPEPDYSIVDLDDSRFFGGLGLSTIQDNSVDYIITSNLNSLYANINDIFRESWRILKAGGEICFSGQFSNLKVKNMYDTNHFLLKPFYLEDIRRALYKNGFVCYQTLKSHELCYEKNEDTSKDLSISHKTLNSFKIYTLEDCAEDYGQLATYKGTVPGQRENFFLDIKNTFATRRPTRVSGNIAEILIHSRHKVHFDVSKSLNHRGPFIS